MASLLQAIEIESTVDFIEMKDYLHAHDSSVFG